MPHDQSSTAFALRPMRKCGELTAAQQSKMQAKREAKEKLALLMTVLRTNGFTGRGIARALQARNVKCTESALRGWENPLAMDRHPPADALQALDEIVQNRFGFSLLATG